MKYQTTWDERRKGLAVLACVATTPTLMSLYWLSNFLMALSNPQRSGSVSSTIVPTLIETAGVAVAGWIFFFYTYLNYRLDKIGQELAGAPGPNCEIEVPMAPGRMVALILLPLSAYIGWMIYAAW